MSRPPVPPLARCAASHALARSRIDDPCDRRPADYPQLFAALARQRKVLPIFVAAVAAGRPLADAAVRPGRQLEPLRGEGGSAATRGAARLLLFHSDALCVAHARGL